MAKHAAPLSIFTWAFLIFGLLLFALAGVEWANHVGDEGRFAANNISYAGQPMEGASRDEVGAAVERRAGQALGHTLLIDYGHGELSVDLESVGYSYDRQATADEIMGARHQGSVWEQFSSWVLGSLVTYQVDERWGFDPETARTALDDHPGLTPVVVAEPVIVPDGEGRIELVPGVIGTEADIDEIVATLETIDLTDPPDRITVPAEEIHPTVSDEAAQQRVDDLNHLTGEGKGIWVNGKGVVIPAATLQSHLSVDIGGGEITERFDGAGLQETIESAIVGPVGRFVEPTFDVVDGVVTVVTPGEPPPVCCAPGSGDLLGQQILAGTPGPIALEPRPADEPGLVAWADGSATVDVVGEFTTPHNCCETRVRNIQRMADIVRGVYLVPGETLSLNEYVGPRTVENGFFSAGAIRQGHLIEEVGGGVSQFATTIFNAAYFAGMDIVEYRSHTIYFSRYPYGREATISNPAPDLVMVNTTDHPILIWTSYTDTSVTVTMYSTRHVEVAELDQRVSRRGACTHVETDRQRTYPDGRVVVDTFLADYRPAEGIDCNGNPIPPPEL